MSGERQTISRTRPVRPEPNRPPAHRRRPDRPLQLPLRPAHRGRFHPQDRGYRPGAVARRIYRGDPGKHDLAGVNVGRGPGVSEQARRPVPRGRRPARGRKEGLPLLLQQRAARGKAQARRGAQGKADVRRHLPGQGPARPGRALRGPLPLSSGRCHRVQRPHQGAYRLREQGAGRPDHPPLRRLPDLQPHRRRGRYGHGASPTSYGATTTSTTRPARSRYSRPSATRCPPSPTSPSCSGPTAPGSPSATGQSR